MVHYSIQITLSELKDACLPSPPTLEDPTWSRQWADKGGGRYVGHYPSGQAVISGPLLVGNPNAPWFEIQCADDAILTDIGHGDAMTMKAKNRASGFMRAAYKASGRTMIRNSRGKPVGPMPRFTICGRFPIPSYLDGEDLDEAQELPDLD